MDERALRRRVDRIVAIVLATAFAATVAWSAARDDDAEAGREDPEAARVDRERLLEEIEARRDGLEPHPAVDAPVVLPPPAPLEPLEPSVPFEPMSLTVHRDGCGVIRSEAPTGLSRLNWLVRDADGFEVLQRNALGEDRYRYFEPGRYTVVLQTLGPAGYEEISNTVEISC